MLCKYCDCDHPDTTEYWCVEKMGRHHCKKQIADRYSLPKGWTLTRDGDMIREG